MSDEIVPERLLTYPEEEEQGSSGDHNLKQVLVRMHRGDNESLRLLLKKDRMSLQKFFSLCVRGYMEADPFMLKMLKNYRKTDVSVHEAQNKHVLSHRERAAIFEEIERSGGFDEAVKEAEETRKEREG